MIKEVFSLIYQNKNLLMLSTVGIYIFSLFGVLSGYFIVIASVLVILLTAIYFNQLLPRKIILVWILIFFVGFINTTIRLKENDELLSLTPLNSTIYGKIISIPQNKGDSKTKFYFNVDKIEYDNITKIFRDEKVLVTISSDEKFQIYDSYKIRGRLSTPFNAGNPSQFDYGEYLRNYNTYAVFYGRNPYEMKDIDIPCFEKIPGQNSLTETILQKINRHRENILSVHSKFLSSPNLEILGGVVFGDDAVAPPENIKKSFVNSGLLHILAASGMNVAFIYSFFFLLLNFARVPFRVNISLCILAVITYVLMTGLGASVVRAALMLLFVLIGKLIDRDANNISLLSFVAFLMLLYNPMLINDVGFQLSFVVTFGLLLTMPYLNKSKNGFINWLIGAISVPIIAQLWVIPIQIFYFNNISIYSVFANIMSVPILFVISFGGFISSLLSLIKPIADYVCRCFDFILNPLITFLVNISDFWGNLPNSTMQTTHPSPFQIILYYLILINIIAFMNKDVREKAGKFLKITLPVFLVILLISTIQIPNHNLEITAFDVGNADAFLIKTPDKKYLMIDTGKNGYNGGKSQAEIIIMKYMKDIGVKNIDSIIITHFDNDHCGGAVDLINGLKVNNIYVNNKNHDSKAAKEIYLSADKNSTNIVEAQNKQVVLDSENLKIVNFISPKIKGVGDNESSIITLLTYNNFSMLFTGDAGYETLDSLKADLPENITVLKVGHHGASGVINKDWASYLSPEFAIVSTGENKFGHPSIYTLETLRESEILRTDIYNAVRVVVNDKNYKVLSYNSGKRKFLPIAK